MNRVFVLLIALSLHGCNKRGFSGSSDEELSDNRGLSEFSVEIQSNDFGGNGERLAAISMAEKIARFHELNHSDGKWPNPVQFFGTPTYQGSVLGEGYRTDIYYHLKKATFQIRLFDTGLIQCEATWARESDHERFPHLPYKQLPPSTLEEDSRLPPEAWIVSKPVP